MESKPSTSFNPFDNVYLWRSKESIASAQIIAQQNADLLVESRNKMVQLFNSLESDQNLLRQGLLINLFS